MPVVQVEITAPAADYAQVVDRFMSTRMRCPRCYGGHLEGFNPYELSVICLDCGFETRAPVALRQGMAFNERLEVGAYADDEALRQEHIASQRAAGEGEGLPLSDEAWTATRALALARVEARLTECYRLALYSEEASAKARVLLMRVLNPIQRAEYEADKRFTLVGSLGGRYRIAHGRVGNVSLLNDAGDPVIVYCAHPRERMPVEDVLIAQKLSLLTDEAAFIAVANVTRRRDA